MIPDSKDIVPHLRYWGEKVREHQGRIVPSFLIQAADEIERLRAELEELNGKEAKDGHAQAD